MKINLNRSDKQYTDVENFKKYELTNCVAYEMAIRNKNVIELVTNGFIEYIEKDINQEMKEPTLEELGAMKYSGKYFKELRDTYLLPQGLYLKYHFFKEIWGRIELLIRQKEEYYKKLEKITETIKKEKRQSTKEERDFVESKKNIRMLPSLIFEKRISEFLDIHNDNDTTYTIREQETDIFMEKFYHIEDEKEEKITAQDIEPNYSRPKLFDFYHAKERKIKFNLAMPKNELIDFLKIVKDSYDKDNQSILSVSELLGEEKQQPFKDIIFKEDNEHIKDRKTKKTVRATSYTSNAFKMADILFIYDCLSLGYNHQKIIYLLVDYYDTCNKKDTIDPERYRKYVAIGKDFIDNMRYKELFLGSSI